MVAFGTCKLPSQQAIRNSLTREQSLQILKKGFTFAIINDVFMKITALDVGYDRGRNYVA